jgi:hypothetical protein
VDTLKAARQLEASGFASGQAEALVRTIAGSGARHGVPDLRRDLHVLKLMVGVTILMMIGALWHVIA